MQTKPEKLTTEKTNDVSSAVRDMLDTIYSPFVGSQEVDEADLSASMAPQKTDMNQHGSLVRQTMPEICADLIDVDEIQNEDNQFIQVADLYDENDIEQQELYCKVKEDSLVQDRSEDTNQSARSGSTFSLPGSRQ